jgi:hypothetical protein
MIPDCQLGICQDMFPFGANSATKFRSVSRDRRTDEERISAIEAVVRSALAAAEREKSVLSDRLQEACLRATFLAGTGTYEDQSRQPERTAELAGSEAQMRRAEDRLAELDTHISRLKQIESLLADGQSGN